MGKSKTKCKIRKRKCPLIRELGKVTFILQLTRLRSKKIQILSQGHTASKWQSWVYTQKLVFSARIFKYMLCLVSVVSDSLRPHTL